MIKIILPVARDGANPYPSRMSDDRIKIDLPNGMTAWVTLDQLLAISGGEIAPSPKKRRGRGTPAPKQDDGLANLAPWEKFIHYISGVADKDIRQRKVLALIKGAGIQGITIDDLAKQMGDRSKGDPAKYDANITSGTITGIVRNAMKAGLDRDEVVYKPSKSSRLWRAGAQLDENKIPDP